jgi:hypothetical protein
MLNRYIRISAGAVLLIVFLVLKLINSIDWSWWWVTSPLWIPFAGLLFIDLIEFTVAVIRDLSK